MIVSSATVKKSKGWLLPLTLAAIGGALIAWIIGNYETLIPYRWERFTTPDGTVSMEFPGRTVAEDQQRALPGGGTVTVHMVGTQTADDSYYGLGYPNVRNSGDKSPEDNLDSARDGAVKNGQVALITEKRINVQGFPARDIQARGRAGSFLDMRLVAIDGQVLILTVSSTGENSRDVKNIQKFFASFKVRRPDATNGLH